MDRLIPLDDEHFYFDDVLIDLPSLNVDAYRVAYSPTGDGSKIHALGFELAYQYHVAKCLSMNDTKFLKAEIVEKSLTRLNSLGVKTGWTKQ